MNIMLIDADMDNLRNFRTHIRSAFPDMRVVGTVSELTRDIAAAVREQQPGLIVADIKFFSGARFIRFKELHEEFPELRYIVYGTYDEADYMKRAGDFGVIDFMFRPVKPADLNRCLTQAAAHFKRQEEKRRKSRELEREYQSKISQFEDIFLRGLMDGHITNENEIRNAFDYFNFPQDSGYTVFTIRIDHYRQVALALEEMEKHLLILKIHTVVKSELEERNAQTFIQSFNEINILLNGGMLPHEKIMLGDKIKNAIFERADTRVTIGIGRTYEKPSDISVSRREADAAFRYRYRMGYNSVIPIEFVEPDNRITYLYPIERERRLVYSIVVGDYEYSRQVLTELFNALTSVKPLPEHFIGNLVMTIVFDVSRYISEQNLPIANQVTKFFPTAEILRLTQPEDAFEFLNLSAKRFCAFVEAHVRQDSEKLHKAAREYVREHYAETFTLAKVAASLETTPENLNKVFLEHEKMMMFEFVMWVRVYEAQRLLKESDLDEEAVAGGVGFDDVKYFRSIFKKYNGQTPAEYRSAERK